VAYFATNLILDVDEVAKRSFVVDAQGRGIRLPGDPAVIQPMAVMDEEAVRKWQALGATFFRTSTGPEAVKELLEKLDLDVTSCELRQALADAQTAPRRHKI